jgi:hypothetical protein
MSVEYVYTAVACQSLRRDVCDDRASRPTAVFQQILTRTLRAILYCRGKGDALNGLVWFSMILPLLDPRASG